MNRGDATKELLIERIIQLLIKRPMIAALDIQKILESNNFPKLTESYIGRLRKMLIVAWPITNGVFSMGTS